MKRLLGIGALLTIIAGLCFAVGTKQENGFRVIAVGGERADVKCRVAGEYIAAETNKTYAFGTIVKTGRASTVDLELTPGNTFRLMPRSRMAIKVDTRNPKLKIISVEKGRVEIKLDNFPKDEKLHVETPTAVCGALGTRFTIAFEDDEDDKKAGTRESQIICDRGEIFARSRFTLNDAVQDGKMFNAPSIGANTEIVAMVHEGLENSYTDITVNRGSLKVGYGVEGTTSFTLKPEADDKPVRFVCALEKSDDEVKAAVIEVKSGSVTRSRKSGFTMQDEEIESTSGAVVVTKDGVTEFTAEDESGILVANYLTAAKEEAQLHSELVATGKPVKGNAKLKAAADKATKLRKDLFVTRMNRILKQIRRANRRLPRRR